MDTSFETQGRSLSHCSHLILEAFYVVVEDLDEQDRKAGLTNRQLQTDLEVKLRKAGILIDSEADPFLYLTVNVIHDGTGYSASINLTFNLWVIREDTQWEGYAATWDRGAAASSGRSGGGRHFRNVVGDMVDIFINDYLTANPKE